MRVWVGTSGFSYKEWKGNFYPEDLQASGMLAYYGERLNSVEINNTFYRMPSRKVLAEWGERVPDSFMFVLKASRKITHFKRLKPEAEDELAYLLDVSGELGERRGPILFQLPPNFKKDIERLKAFLAFFPDGLRAAFEFRNPSWFDDEVYAALREHDVALVAADTGKEGEDPPVVPTASYGYARLRKEAYEPGEIESWAERLTAPDWEDSYVFFKHEDAGAGPALAKAFRELADCG